MNKPIKMTVIKGDITKLKVDAIVNAANSSLMGGGGVDGAIHSAGGPAILQDCKRIVAEQGACEVGHAVITTAGLLPSQFVIHTVGPVWRGGHDGEKEKLASSYTQSLKLALTHKLRTIAFPNISTGIFGFPKDLAAKIAVQTVKDFAGEFQEIIFICFDQENFDLIQKEINAT